jgi:hypothetical protein
MKTLLFSASFLLGLLIQASEQAAIPSTAMPTLTVDCKAPWVVVAEAIINRLPASLGPQLCSSLLGKYQTTTGSYFHWYTTRHQLMTLRLTMAI